LSNSIIGAAIEVLGPGLLESGYKECFCRELTSRHIPFERQAVLPVEYKGAKVACDLRLDVLVDDLVIVELKAVEKIAPIPQAQLTYLRLQKLWLGLLINFNPPMLKDGIKRLVNG
jgi:GxxExxY protein